MRASGGGDAAVHRQQSLQREPFRCWWRESGVSQRRRSKARDPGVDKEAT